MSKYLLGNYSLSASENILYHLSFEIPDNCYYEVRSLAGTHCIAICLKDGEKEPSSKFITCEREFTLEDHKLTIEFDQQCDGIETSAKRPVIRIED